MTSATAMVTAGSGRKPRSAALPALVTVLAIAALIYGAILDVSTAASTASSPPPWSLLQGGSFSGASVVLGAILIRHDAARAVGTILLIGGVAGAASILLTGLGDLALRDGRSSAVLLHLSVELLWPLFVIMPLTALPLVFPSGLLPGVVWRVLAGMTAVVLAGMMIASATQPAILIGESESTLPNPWSAPGLSAVLILVTQPLALLCALGGLSALVVRAISGDRRVRQQILVLVVALAVNLLAVTVGSILIPEVAFQALMIVCPLLILAAIAVAVLRYELYDIRVVITRVTLYSILTVAMTVLFAAVYLSSLAFAAQLPFASDRWVAAVIGAAVVALCIDPLRRHLRDVLERRFLGERRRPLIAMAKLRASVLERDDEPVTDAVARTVADAVRSPRVELRVYGIDVAEDATVPPDGRSLVVPLLYLQERIGEMRVEPRSPREQYGPRDRELLSQLAGEAAAILYSVRRDEELADARREAITVAARERARLGRDLHDGLGPLLAGAGLAAEALRQGLPRGSSDQQDAAHLAERLRSAAGEIRRIAHDLQPVVLADRGLECALLDHLDSLRGDDVPSFELTVDIGIMSEAVQQTTYFLTLEAVSNVLRHAAASRATISILEGDADVAVVIADDGIGLRTPFTSGIGLTSMRRRVEALGGSFAMSRRKPAGTMISAVMPTET